MLNSYNAQDYPVPQNLVTGPGPLLVNTRSQESQTRAGSTFKMTLSTLPHLTQHTHTLACKTPSLVPQHESPKWYLSSSLSPQPCSELPQCSCGAFCTLISNNRQHLQLSTTHSTNPDFQLLQETWRIWTLGGLGFHKPLAWAGQPGHKGSKWLLSCCPH